MLQIDWANNIAALREIGAWSIVAFFVGRWLLKRTRSADDIADTSQKDRELSVSVTERTIARLELLAEQSKQHERECNEKLNQLTLQLARAETNIQWIEKTATGAFFRAAAATEAQQHTVASKPPNPTNSEQT